MKKLIVANWKMNKTVSGAASTVKELKKLVTNIKNVDIVASAVKEALTTAKPAPVKDSDVYLVLPQESFLFARYEIPTDIQQSAIVPFVKDKARADFPFDVETSYFDFFVLSN